MPHVPEIRPGPLRLATLNLLVAAANRVANFSVSGAAEATVSDAGIALYVPPCREYLPIKITGGGTGGKYAWTRQRPIAAAPYWEDHGDNPESGTTLEDPAIEMNLTDSIAAGTYVPAWREPGFEGLRFKLGACS